MSKFLIYSDGGARGNPGPAAYGYIIKFSMINDQFSNKSQISKTKYQIIKRSKFIDTATNNQAEYQGILNALKCLKLKIKNLKLKIDEVVCYLDSQLIVEQMKGNYKIKNEGLKPLYWEIRSLILELGGNIRFEFIPREKNKEADKLVNEAIDKYLKKDN